MLLNLIASRLGSGGGAEVTLTGGTVNKADAVAPYDTNVAIKVLADGTLEFGTSTNGDSIVYVQQDAATDWIIPNVDASSDFDVRFTNYVDGGDGDAFTTLAAAVDTWIDLGTDRVWLFNDTAVNAGNGFTVDFEIRDGSGTTVASGSFTFTITNTA